MNHYQFFAVSGISIDFISYAIYYYGIFFGKIKPHLFTWFIWGVMNIAVFFAQLVRGGGAGSWISASSGIFCLSVAIISFWCGEKDVTKSDFVCLIAGMIGIFGWTVTGNPLISVLIACFIDFFAIFPTFRKAYHKPYEENVLGFSIALLTFVFQLFALESFNLTTALLPIVILVNDSCLVITILIRRKYFKRMS